MTLLIVFLLTALVVSFLCSLLEASLMSTPVSYVTMREEEGYKPAARFKQYKLDSSRPIAAILILNTIANTIGSAGVGAQATQLFGSQWFGLVSAIFTLLILVFSEIIPKTIGATHWKNLIGFTSGSIRILIFILYPIVRSVEFLQRLLTPKGEEVMVTREEISAMADVAEESGELDEDENEVIQNLINLEDLQADSAMTPRVVCSVASESMTVGRFYKDKRFLHHSRIPVFNQNQDYITGYVLRMDALQLVADDKKDVPLGNLKREIASFQEDTPLDIIWGEMIEKDEQIAVIIDEYGCFQGILTLEDVIETILGDEIVDEQDAVRDMQQLARDKWKKRNKSGND